MNSNSIPLRIAAADHGGRAMSGTLNDERVMHGIISTHLLIAAATPGGQLERLYDEWNSMETLHPAHDGALCPVLELLDLVMLPEGLVA